MASTRGHPSTGCSKCRARKIKCDENKPVCARCIKIGNSDCVYRDQFERTWHNETDQAAGRAQKKWRSRSKKQADDTVGDSSTSETTTVSPLSSSLEDVVMERLFFDWVIASTPASSTLFLPFLPLMYKNTNPGSVLAEAVSALAYANYGQRMNSPECTARALQSYSNALRLLGRAIGGGSAEFRTDETLLSVVLLGMYEALVSPVVTAKGSWTAHLNGAIMLIRMGVTQDSNSKIVTGISGLIMTQMLNNCVVRGHSPELPLEFRNTFAQNISANYTLWEHIYKEAELLAPLREILKTHYQTGHAPASELQQILAEAVSLDKSLDDWVRTMSADSFYTPIGADKSSQPGWISPLLEGSWVPQTAHKYPSWLAETKWRTYWTNRLVLDQAILLCITMLESAGLPPESFPINRREVEFTIISIVDKICESTLSAFTQSLEPKPKAETAEDFCSVRGYVLLSPAPTALCCLKQISISGLDLSGRIQWLERVLSLLEFNVGFAKAGAIPSHTDMIPFQLWGLGEENALMEGIQGA